ncbi:MAG: hypothetical protein FWC76_02045 [Defluviitaleaceae bacterium]|nr:hypothetical protein [Defluviitaleaceae bacterium]
MKSALSSKSTKIIVDVCMIVFLVLSFVRWEGDPTFHFVVGAGCTLFFAAHVFIHRKWIKAVTKSCMAGKLNKSLKWKYVIDMLLLVMWGIAIATGFLAIGSYVGGIDWMFVFSRIHGITSRIGLVLIVIHVIQHWPQIKSYFPRKKVA